MRRPTLLELLVIVATIAIAIVIALLVFPGDWVGNGDIELPVRIVVFDVTTGEPIEKADVFLVRAPTAREESDLQESSESLTSVELERWPHAKTQSDGSATIDYLFHTVVSNEHPSHAYATGSWVVVSAEGYGRFATPLRYEAIKTEWLREQGELCVSVGLYPAEEDVD